MPQLKPIDKILDINSYSKDRRVAFRIDGPGQSEERASTSVEIPISIVYRLYYLGRAYDFQAVKLVRPGGSVRIEYVQLQLLLYELEQIPQLINDPVAHHYLDMLLPILRNTCKTTKSSLFVFEK